MPATSETASSAKKSSKPSLFSRLRRIIKSLQVRQWLGLVLLCSMLIGVVWMFAAQRSSDTTDPDKLQVTATFYPLYDFASQVGGSLAQVSNGTPAGAEAHDYEPTPQNLAAAIKSDVFIYNDSTMEPWVSKFLTDYKGITVEAVDAITGFHQPNHTDHDDEQSTSHDHANDPHSWTDPLLAQAIVQSIADGYKKADPDHASIYQDNANSYIAQLAQLDRDFSQGLATCQKRTIVTSHSAFSYLAERYQIDVLPISGLSPDQEPSATKLAELTKLVKQHQISYIFFENQTSPQLAQALARETGAKTLVLNPVESLTQKELNQHHNYLSVQRSNLAHLRLALSCQ